MIPQNEIDAILARWQQKPEDLGLVVYNSATEEIHVASFDAHGHGSFETRWLGRLRLWTSRTRVCMNTIADVTDDELALAQLASKKLMELVDGFLSVSLASLFLGDPHSFISGRNKLIVSFIDVVGATGAKPASAFTRKLQTLTGQLAEQTTLFYSILVRVAGWRSLGVEEIEADFESLKANYGQITEISDRLFELLGTGAHPEDRRLASRQMIDETMQQLCARCEQDTAAQT
jgi:hypothetical protein